MNDQWTDRLSEYLDGELADAERMALEAHLATCAECTAVLADLRRVVARAQALDDRPPARDLWSGIAERIGISTDDLARRRARRRVSFTVPQLIAASVALIALSAGVARLVLRPTTNREPTAMNPGSVSVVPVAIQKAGATADHDVQDLRLALADGQRTGRLSPMTVHRIEHSLAVIDSALAEGKRALAVDPKSAYLNQHLADTMRRKMEFLREANRIASPRT
ncbi:MAG TPA: zf-HC2 domain-containing protein [Gemmatimonadales bacterium]|nr:zf-HC2 domain-containing protein [Gemmatimonadales bacterium]